ncbi:hypothetical protein [Sphingomonas hankookensis]
MQTPFITDLRAVAVPVATATGPTAALSIRYFDHTGRQVGTSVALAADMIVQGRALMALGEAAVLNAAAADGAWMPKPVHFPIMRDVRIADAPEPAADAKASVVIYGPRASGKTFHAERFRKRYECERILDLSGEHGKRRLGSGTLVLTDATKAEARSRYGRDALLVSIHDARSAIGVGPVRPLAEWRAE